MQDLGAAGLTSATVESASRARRGVLLDIAQVHRRETDMTAYEVMLSESQERMLLVVPPDKTDRVKAVFDKWDIPCREIGTVIAEPETRVFDGPQPIARLSVQDLIRAPSYRLQGTPSPEQKQRQLVVERDLLDQRHEVMLAKSQQISELKQRVQAAEMQKQALNKMLSQADHFHINEVPGNPARSSAVK